MKIKRYENRVILKNRVILNRILGKFYNLEGYLYKPYDYGLNSFIRYLNRIHKNLNEK